MRYQIHEHRHALNLFTTDQEFVPLYQEIVDVLDGISDEDVIAEYNANHRENIKSLSEPINALIRRRLSASGWRAESAIFSDPAYADARDKKRWRLDFAKEKISVEVAFNHGEAIAWNLIKPVLASELNHVAKDIQTSAGIIICATNGMKKAGNFDSAVGSYEKFLRYLLPLQNMLPTPILIIGLDAPDTVSYTHLLVYSGFRRFLICFTYSLTLLSPLFPSVPEPYVVIYVVKNASRPVSGEDSPVPGGKRFVFQTVCIVTLSRVLCKWFSGRIAAQRLSRYRQRNTRMPYSLKIKLASPQ